MFFINADGYFIFVTDVEETMSYGRTFLIDKYSWHIWYSAYRDYDIKILVEINGCSL